MYVPSPKRCFLAAFGGADEFPQHFGEFAANGNHLEPDEIAVRLGVCGDSSQVGGGPLHAAASSHTAVPAPVRVPQLSKKLVIDLAN